MMSIARPVRFPSSGNGPPSDSDTPRPCGGLLKPNFISWRVLGGFFAASLVIGWVLIIVILIQKEKWQLVLVAWLLLYAAAHFCYWYFKRHHLLSIHARHRRRSRRPQGSVEPVEKIPDAPPTYDEIIATESPPPEYFSVVVDPPKVSSSKRRAFGLPKVFGRQSSTSSLPSESPFYGQRLTSSGPSRVITISESVAEMRPKSKIAFECRPPPPYETPPNPLEASTSATSPPSSPPTRVVSLLGRSPTRQPVLSPIYNNIDAENRFNKISNKHHKARRHHRIADENS